MIAFPLTLVARLVGPDGQSHGEIRVRCTAEGQLFSAVRLVAREAIEARLRAEIWEERE